MKIKRIEFLQNLKLNFNNTEIGTIKANITILGQQLKEFTSLQIFELNINKCQLGKFQDNAQNLFDSIRGFTNLKKLNLNLKQNRLRYNSLQYLGKILQELTTLSDLKLDISDNRLSNQNSENIGLFGQSLAALKVSLINLSLNLGNNNLGKNSDNMKYLGEGLKSLTKLKSLKLRIQDNNLWENAVNIKYLGEGLKGLVSLQYLSIDFKRNLIGQNIDDCMYLGEGLNKLVSLTYLELDFYQNYIGFNDNNNDLMDLSKGLQGMVALQTMRLDFTRNYIGQKEEDVQVLCQGLLRLNQLQNLDLYLEKKRDSYSDCDSSDSDYQIKKDENYQKCLLDFMPEANPLQPKQYSQLVEIYTAYKTQFNQLPQFNKDNNYIFDEPEISLLKDSQKEQQQQNNNNNSNSNNNQENNNNNNNINSLYSYHLNNKEKLVYKRYGDYDLNKPTKINDRVYFATYVVSLKKYINNISENNTQQQLIPPALTYSTDTLKQLQDGGKNNTNNNIVQQQADLKNNDENSKLIFDSNFESGNLFCAYQVNENEYDLVLQNDINTRGNTQWFFFSVKNVKKNQTVKFNMLNLIKKGSLFNDGLCPCVYSQTANELFNQEWVREGFDIGYYKNGFQKDGSFKRVQYYYTLSFSYKFKYEGDTVYFAHSYPYTASDLYNYLNRLVQSEEINKIMNKKTLCKTLAGNNCEMIIITSPSLKKRKYRKAVVITARQHPGETGGSYMMQGVIDFLTGNSLEAQKLRELCIFKIIPMINVDGVVHGNYRTSLAGCDLNRQWKKPKRKLQPTVFYIKELIKKFKQDRDVKLILDLHGHSRKMNAFFYGCNYQENPVLTRIFPYMLSKINPKISFSDCRFSQNLYKEGTARVALWKEIKIPNIFTLEASFYGTKKQEGKQKHFSIQDYFKIGNDICMCIYDLVKDENIKQKSYENQRQYNDNKYVNNVISELNQKKDLMEGQDGSDGGSDSCPSEDELGLDEMNSFLPKSALSKKQKKQLKKLQDKKQQLLQQQQKQKKQKEEQEKLQQQQKPKPRSIVQKSEKKPVQKEEKKQEKEKPEMVDKYQQTDTSFLLEYRAFLKNKQKQQQQQSLDSRKDSNSSNSNMSNSYPKKLQQQLSSRSIIAKNNNRKIVQNLNTLQNQDQVSRNFRIRQSNSNNNNDISQIQQQYSSQYTRQKFGTNIINNNNNGNNYSNTNIFKQQQQQQFQQYGNKPQTPLLSPQKKKTMLQQQHQQQQQNSQMPQIYQQQQSQQQQKQQQYRNNLQLQRQNSQKLFQQKSNTFYGSNLIQQNNQSLLQQQQQQQNGQNQRYNQYYNTNNNSNLQQQNQQQYNMKKYKQYSSSNNNQFNNNNLQGNQSLNMGYQKYNQSIRQTGIIGISGSHQQNNRKQF